MLSNKQIRQLDRKEFEEAINGTFKEITLYNKDFTLEYYDEVDINVWDSQIFYEPNKILITKTIIDEQEYILNNTDKKYNIFSNVIIKYTIMDIAETLQEVIEIYNSNNIQNQSIDDFWANDTHYVKKKTIKGNEYYECIFDMYFNSEVSKNLNQKNNRR